MVGGEEKQPRALRSPSILPFALHRSLCPLSGTGIEMGSLISLLG